MNIDSKLRNIGEKVIETESNSINLLKDVINSDLIETIHSIHACKGRMIVSGIGKSALIGQKMVATLNSIGISSTFLHGADAIHGDIGVIQSDDIVFVISKSGETPELLVLLPLLKDMGVKTIAMVSNANSSLAKSSNRLIYIPIENEADPFNLIPTSSTVNQIVMSDVIAMMLLELQEFTEDEFAKYHPGGTIGKQLYLQVEALVDLERVPSVSIDENLQGIVIEISSKRQGATAVLSAGELVGIITDGDLRRAMVNGGSFDQLLASDIMSSNPMVVQHNDMVSKAYKAMKEKNITQLLVKKENKFLGIIHLHDILKEGFL